MSSLRYAALLLAAAALGCGAPGASTTSETKPGAPALAPVSAPELNLSRVADGQFGIVLRAPDDRRPRMVDVRVRWSKGWKLSDSKAGETAAAAQKSLVVKPVSDTEARVLVFSSTNTQRLNDGVLAQLSLSGSGKGTIEIVPLPPMLAPAEAEPGLHIGDPLAL